MVVRPKEFNDVQQYRLDQYMMKGGRVLMFITLGELAPDMMGRGHQLKQFKTGLEDWLEHHGVRVPAEIVAHESACELVQGQSRARDGQVQLVLIPVHLWPIITREMEGCLDQENPAVQKIRGMRLFWPHPVELLDSKIAESVESTVLVRSHGKESWRWKDLTRVGIVEVWEGVKSGVDRASKRYSSPLIVALDGEFESYYASNPVPPALGEPEEGEAENGEEPQTETPEVTKKSSRTQLVVVGNSLFISDLLLGGGRANDDRTIQAAQVAFNLVDWLARAPELIALRAKKFSDRTLIDMVEDELKEIEKELEQGDITREELQQRMTDAQDAQKAERKKWRWLNTIIPCGIILLAGMGVWILRLARRAAGGGIPDAVAPTPGEEA